MNSRCSLGKKRQVTREKSDHYSAGYASWKQTSTPRAPKADKTWNSLGRLTKIRTSGRRWPRPYKARIRVNGPQSTSWRSKTDFLMTSCTPKFTSKHLHTKRRQWVRSTAAKTPTARMSVRMALHRRSATARMAGMQGTVSVIMSLPSQEVHSR